MLALEVLEDYDGGVNKARVENRLHPSLLSQSQLPHHFSQSPFMNAASCHFKNNSSILRNILRHDVINVYDVIDIA